MHIDGIAGHHFVMNHRRGIVAGVFTGAVRIRKDGGAKYVVHIHIGAADTFINHVITILVGDRQPSNTYLYF